MRTPRAIKALTRRLIGDLNVYGGRYGHYYTDDEYYITSGGWAFDLSHFLPEDRGALHATLKGSLDATNADDLHMPELKKAFETYEQRAKTVGMPTEDTLVRIHDRHPMTVFGPPRHAENGRLVIVPTKHVDMAEIVANRATLTYTLVTAGVPYLVIRRRAQIIGAIAQARTDLAPLQHVKKFLP